MTEPTHDTPGQRTGTPAQPFYLQAPAVVSALGAGLAETAERLFAGDRAGMVQEEGWRPQGPARVGRARSELPAMPAAFAAFDCRCNQLLLAAMQQIAGPLDAMLKRYGPARIGVVLGTSNSGIGEGEAAVAAVHKTGARPTSYAYAQQEIGMPGPFLARLLGVMGPAYTVSTACTSGAKAFAAGRRLLRSGLCDAVVVGGVDPLTGLTVNGFASLESLSPDICNPLSANRRGINIGEAATLFVMTREPLDDHRIALLGVGESSDAHHISAPEPSGRGAEAAMRGALADAGLPPEAIGYLNLHATATPQNDAMESKAVARVFPGGVPLSGTKPMTGHTLGTAGAIEAAFCWMAISHGRLPPHCWDGQADAALPTLTLTSTGSRFADSDTVRACMSNSFAFGGNNASLIIGRVAAGA